MTGSTGALKSRITKLELGSQFASPDPPDWELDSDWLGDYFETLTRFNVCGATALARLESEVADAEAAGRDIDAEILRRQLGWRRWERATLLRLVPEIGGSLDIGREHSEPVPSSQADESIALTLEDS